MAQRHRFLTIILAMLFAVGLVLPTAGLAIAQTGEPVDVTGRWEGMLAVQGTELTIVVQIEESESEITATIDIPQQGANGLPLSAVQLDEEMIYFEAFEGPRLASFTGKIQEDGTIEGTFEQVGIEGFFTLARVTSPTAVETHVPPPYVVEEVAVANGDVTLAGTLTLPPGTGPHPAVVLISGSGPQNRNEEIPSLPGYRPFALIADHLTRQGVAVLRYDDRGVGGSTGDHTIATLADFADDAEAVFTYLQGRDEIDAAQVGLFGHSEGSLIGAMITARNPAVAFFIAMGATARNGYEILLEQNEDILRASGADEKAIEAEVARVQEALDLVRAEDWEALEALMVQEIMKQVEALPEEQQASIGDLKAYAQAQAAAGMVNNQGWMHFFITYDVAADWAKIEVPVLVLLGKLDTQVDLAEAQASLQEAFARSGNSDTTIEVYPQANHLFQVAETGSPDEYAELPKEFVPGFLETIADWLLARVETVWETQATGLQALDEILQAEMEQLGVPGTAIAVVKDGRVLYEKGFGVASVETQQPVTAKMLFRIGSTTKMYTALALAMLAGEGSVDLHAPIGDTVEGLDPAMAELTGDQLLTHMAGIMDDGPTFGPHDPVALGETIRAWTGESHRFAEPDKVFSYSNPGYAMAGLLLQAAGDVPYAEAVEDLILDPLGMTRSTFAPTEAMTYPFSQGHQPEADGSAAVVHPYPDHAGYWPAGFMISNVGELARFAVAFMAGGVLDGHQVIPRTAIESVSTPHAVMTEETQYGYGLFLHEVRGVDVVEHAGSILGFGALFKMVPEHHFAVIILANKSGAIFTKTAEQAMELLLPLEPKAEADDKPVTLSEEELARYAGAYAQVPGQVLTVSLKEGGLVVSISGVDMPAIPFGEDQFRVEMPGMAEPISVRFIAGDDGEIEYLTAANRAYKKQ